MFRGALESAVSQDYSDCEFLILDDCSTDDTPVVSKEYSRADKRVRYIRNARNLDFARNLQRCLLLARGEYVIILADDDHLLPGAIRSYADTFDNFPSVGVVMSNMYQLDESGTKCTYVIRYFETSKTYRSGQEAFTCLWPLATFISGIGIRRSEHVNSFPGSGVYPQLVMVGRMLTEFDGRGLSNFCVGARVHESQWGGQKLATMEKRERKHVFGELPAMLGQIMSDGKMQMDPSKVLDPFLIQVYRLLVANKRIMEGAHAARDTLKLAFETYPPLRMNFTFLFPSLLSTLVPGRVLSLSKELMRTFALNTVHRGEYRNFKANLADRLLHYSGKGE